MNFAHEYGKGLVKSAALDANTLARVLLPALAGGGLGYLQSGKGQGLRDTILGALAGGGLGYGYNQLGGYDGIASLLGYAPKTNMASGAPDTVKGVADKSYNEAVNPKPTAKAKPSRRFDPRDPKKTPPSAALPLKKPRLEEQDEWETQELNAPRYKYDATPKNVKTQAKFIKKVSSHDKSAIDLRTLASVLAPAAAGGGLGYLASGEDTKIRNAILGALLGGGAGYGYDRMFNGTFGPQEQEAWETEERNTPMHEYNPGPGGKTTQLASQPQYKYDVEKARNAPKSDSKLSTMDFLKSLAGTSGSRADASEKAKQQAVLAEQDAWEAEDLNAPMHKISR
jgi:hypothetical protein